MKKRRYRQAREERKVTRIEEGPAEEGLVKGLLAGLVVVGVLMLFFTSVKTSEQGFSQIYLNELDHKPAVAGQPYDFSFTLENHEGRDAAYAYAVLRDGQEVKGEKLILSPEESFVVAARLAPLAYGEHKVEVRVFVDGKDEPLNVWFWLQVR